MSTNSNSNDAFGRALEQQGITFPELPPIPPVTDVPEDDEQ